MDLLTSFLFASTIFLQTSAGGGSAAADMTSQFVAVWQFEESSSPAQSASGTTCGTTGCPFTWVSTIAQDTTNYNEGSSAIQNTSGTSDSVYCDSRTANGNQCNSLEIAGDVSYGCWTYKAASGGQPYWMRIAASNGTYGYSLYQDNGAQEYIRCRVGASGGSTIEEGNDNISSLTTWRHLSCVYDEDTDGGSGDDAIRPYINATADCGGACATQADMVTDVTNGEWYMAYDLAGQTYQGTSDECFVYDGALSDESLCYIASCGIDGSLCTCNGATYTDDGRHTTMSLSCTLPSNCSTFTTLTTRP